MNKLLFAGLILLVTMALVGGFMAVGGPGHARAEKRDAQRYSDLRRIADHLTCAESAQEVTPSRCARHKDMPDVHDPLTDQDYPVTQGENSFKVCASFETDPEVRGQGYIGRGLGALHFDGPLGCLRYAREDEQADWQMQ